MATFDSNTIETNQNKIKMSRTISPSSPKTITQQKQKIGKNWEKIGEKKGCKSLV